MEDSYYVNFLRKLPKQCKHAKMPGIPHYTLGIAAVAEGLPDTAIVPIFATRQKRYRAVAGTNADDLTDVECSKKNPNF